MGLEFMPIFTDWAAEYDHEINGGNQEYQEVFEGYWETLDEIVRLSGRDVLEFGSGTGNLTAKLLAAGKHVYPVEPSSEMIDVARRKPALEAVEFIVGDMENFPTPDGKVDTIVSNLVFHHLNTQEKISALKRYNQILPLDGKVVFGDTAFLSREVFERIVLEEENRGNTNLAEDLLREYYPLLPNLVEHFKESGFDVRFEQRNRFVWLMEAWKVGEV